MTTKLCFIVGCPNDLSLLRTARNKTRVRYFKAKYINEDAVKEWTKVIPPRGKTAFDPNNQHHVLCELHFEPEKILKTNRFLINGKWEELDIGGRWKLTPDAVPSRFLHYGRLRKRKRKVEEVEKEDEGEEAPDMVEVESQEVIKKLTVNYEKRFFCGVCLNQFVEGFEMLKAMTERDKAYLKLVKFLGKYLEVDWKKFEAGLEWEIENSKEKGRRPGICRTLCGDCLEGRVKPLCKLLEELELIRMKVNKEMVNLENLLNSGDWMERKGDIEDAQLKEVMTLREEILKKKEKYTVPRIRLKRVEDSESTESQVGNGNMDGQQDDLQVDVPAKLVKTLAMPKDNNYLVGTGSLSKLFGVANWITCPTCHKYVGSNQQLKKHQKEYHTGKWKRKLPFQMPVEPVHIDHLGQKDLESVTEVETAQLAPTPALTSSSRDVSPSPVSTTTTETGLANTAEPQVTKMPTLVLNETLLTNEEETGVDEQTDSCPSPAMSTGGDFEDGNEQSTLQNPIDISSEHPPANISEPKEEEPNPPSTSIPKKVPFMSSEYIGKYKIVCKLRNLQTGKTCVGVVAKTPLVPSNSSTSTTTTSRPAMTPKVIQVEPVKPPRIPSKRIPVPPISGPPFYCPYSGCAKKFIDKNVCIRHYKRHYQQLRRIHRDVAHGIKVQATPRKRKKYQRKNPPLKRKEKTPTGTPEISQPQDSLPTTSGDSQHEANSNHRGNYIFQCPIKKCNQRFRLGSGLDFHLHIAHEAAQCHFCSTTLTSGLKLIEHEQTFHQHQNIPENAPAGIMYCPRCPIENYSIRLRYNLTSHYAKAHLGIPLPKLDRGKFLCEPPCNRTFFVLEKLISHVTQFHHNPEEVLDRIVPHKCTECPKRFRTLNKLKSHQKNYHLEGSSAKQLREPTSYQCGQCGKLYTNKNHYDRHLKCHQMWAGWTGKSISKPEDAKTPMPHICDQCGKGFRWAGNLWLHTKEVHEVKEGDVGPLRHCCEKCGKQFLLMRAYKTHCLWNCTALGPRPFIPRRGKAILQKMSCEECGRVFTRKACLLLHKAAHNKDMMFTCEQCGKMFISRGYLNTHKKTHLPGYKRKIGNNLFPAMCQVCGKVWPNTGFLRCHLRRCHPEVPKEEYEISEENGWKCDWCGKVYASIHCLNNHIKKYCGPKKGEPDGV